MRSFLFHAAFAPPIVTTVRKHKPVIIRTLIAWAQNAACTYWLSHMVYGFVKCTWPPSILCTHSAIKAENIQAGKNGKNIKQIFQSFYFLGGRRRDCRGGWPPFTSKPTHAATMYFYGAFSPFFLCSFFSSVKHHLTKMRKPHRHKKTPPNLTVFSGVDSPGIMAQHTVSSQTLPGMRYFYQKCDGFKINGIVQNTRGYICPPAFCPNHSTVTVYFTLLPPAFIVMVATPACFAVSLPVLSTVTTPLLLEA